MVEKIHHFCRKKIILSYHYCLALAADFHIIYVLLYLVKATHSQYHLNTAQRVANATRCKSDK